MQTCSALPCRLQRLDSLARYAALYSDRVYVRNYFSGYDNLTQAPIQELRGQFLDDLTVLNSIAPLINKGLISLVTPVSCMCPSCHGLLDPELRRRLTAINEVASAIVDQACGVVIKRRRGFYEVRVTGPIGLSHVSSWRIQSLEELELPPQLVHSLEPGKSFELPASSAQQALSHLKEVSASDVAYQAATALEFGAAFLTGSEIHASLQQTSRSYVVSKSEEAERVVAPVLLDLPFLNQVPLTALVTLRERHEESFVRFRAALRRAAIELRGDGAGYPGLTLELRNDVIDPELARISNAVESERNRLVSKAIPAVVGLGVLGVGVAGAMATGQPLALFAAGLLASKSIDILSSAVQAKRTTAQPDQSDFFYLWKVKEVALRH